MSRRRKLLVNDVYNREKMHSLLVNEKESIDKMVKKFAEEPSSRGVFVVDEEKTLIGVITRADLLMWAKYKLGAGIASTRIFVPISEIRRYLYSTTVEEVMSKNSSNAFVGPDDDIISALNLMISYNLVDVPVVDQNRKILGDLKLSEILNKILQTG